MITRRQALVGMANLTTGLVVAGQATAKDIGASIDTILKDKAESGHIPGCAFLAVRDGQVVHTAVLGQRDREHNLPATLDTVFPIGSATKPFTSMAVGVAQDRGLLSLSDRPHKFLPYYRMFDADADAKVTLRDMLSHRTGLRAKADLAAQTGVLTSEEYVRAATSARPQYDFGTRFQYSNAQIAAAGEVLGHVAGGSWAKAVTDLVLHPLGMTGAQATMAGLTELPDHATGYVYDSMEGWTATPPSPSLIPMAAAGAICASANDMAKWLLMLTSDQRLVSSKTFAQLIKPQIDIDNRLAYALCWATYGWNGERVVEHNGGGEGICALVSFIPERQTGFVFLGNTSPNFLTVVGNLGPLVYPLLLGVDDVKDVPVPVAQPDTIIVPNNGYKPNPPPRPDIDLDTLLNRMKAALGTPPRGALIAHGDKLYENQGVSADLSLTAAASASHEEIELWRAADRDIGRFRLWSDGDKGGQETTFGQDQVYNAATMAGLRRDLDFWPWPRLDALYEHIEIGGTSWFAGRIPAVTLKLRTRDGGETVLDIALDSWRVVRKMADGVTTEFHDYRDNGGAWLPWRWEVQDSLGLTTVTWRDIAFVAEVPPESFAPAVS